MSVPIIDISPLLFGDLESAEVKSLVAKIHEVCKEHGFFYIVGHGIEKELIERLDALSAEFFKLPYEEKKKIHMKNGGIAWRGFFGLHEELTSGKPDGKEGIYFGLEHDDTHPGVVAKKPMHGKNLFPELPEFKETVLSYMSKVSKLGHVVMSAIALSLGLPHDYFDKNYLLDDPTVLFRIFSYPDSSSDTAEWGVGEHTDYGLLTLLLQDDCGGLEVKTPSKGWIDAPPVADSFVCNIGDMLQLITGGLYRSTPHRVRNTSGRVRRSYPLFFDPNFTAIIKPIEGLEQQIEEAKRADLSERWDKVSVHDFSGTYEQYITQKISRVFPDLKAAVLN